MAGASEITAGRPARWWTARAGMRPATAYALIAAGVAVLTWVVWAQPGADQYDNFFALAWGREIAHGHLPSENVPFAATPHPLTMLIGAGLSQLGGASAFTGLQVTTTVAWGAVVAGAVLAAVAAFDMAAAAVVAVLLTSNPALVQAVDNSLSDGLFAALVLAALAIALHRPRRRIAVMAALAVAGLTRPEAWLLAGAYWVFAARACSNRDRLLLACLALASPVAWALLDAASTGDALFSLTTTRDNTVLVGRATGLANVLPQLRESLGGLLDWPELLGAVAGAALVASRRRMRASLPVAVAVLGVAGFASLGIARLPMNPRYLLLPAVLLTVIAGHGLVEAWRGVVMRGRAWAVGALCVALAAAGAVAYQRAGGLRDRLDQGRAEFRVRDDLSQAAQVARPPACPVRSASYRALSQVAFVSGAPLRATAVTRAHTGRGVYLTPASTVARSLFPVSPQVTTLVARGRVLARTSDWTAIAVGC